MITPLALAALAYMVLTQTPAAPPPPPPTVPSKVKKGPTVKTRMRPFEAAVALKAYLLGGGNFGTKARPSKNVYAAQKVFGIPSDGIVGPVTRRAARKWGVVLPLRRKRQR